MDSKGSEKGKNPFSQQMSKEDKVKEILSELGYRLADRGAYWQTNAVFRDGDNQTAIQIYKDTGVWKDYVEGTEYLPLQALVKKTSGADGKNLDKILGEIKNSSEESGSVEKLQTEKTFDDSVYQNLIPHYDFYTERGISEKTLKHFKSGLCTGGAMYQRHVFPIFNEHQEVHGLSGRDVSLTSNNSRPKWKHMGKTSSWVFPLYLKNNLDYSDCYESIIKTREVIIVESVGDCISLFENGFKNTLVSFGLNISQKLICAITELNPAKITISFNNDKSSQENRGLLASIKNYCKLLSFFDYDKIQICLPTEKDFGEMSTEDFEQWETKKNKINQDQLRSNIKKTAQKLFDNKKLSKNLFSNLKILPLNE
jgi:hypothetical protein